MSNMMKSIGVSVCEWRETTGLKNVNNPGMDLQYLVNQLDADLREMGAEDLEFYIVRIASYNLFLKAEKSKIASRITLIREQYNRILYQEIQNREKVNPEFKYKKVDEKEAVIVNDNESLRRLKDELVDQQVKFEQIKDLPHGIDTKLRTLELMYKQKQRNRNGSI